MKITDLFEAPNRKNIPSNVPPESAYRTPGKTSLRMQATQPKHVSWDDLAQYVDNEPAEQHDTYLRFDPTPGNSIRAFWTRSFTTNYRDAAKLGNVVSIANMSEFFTLTDRLGRAYDVVRVIVEPEDMQAHPEFFTKLKNFSEKSGLAPHDLEFEFVAPRSNRVGSAVAPSPVKHSSFKETPELQAAFVAFFRSHPKLSNQLASIPKSAQASVRSQIMQALDQYEDEAENPIARILAAS